MIYERFGSMNISLYPGIKLLFLCAGLGGIWDQRQGRTLGFVLNYMKWWQAEGGCEIWDITRAGSNLTSCCLESEVEMECLPLGWLVWSVLFMGRSLGTCPTLQNSPSDVTNKPNNTPGPDESLSTMGNTGLPTSQFLSRGNVVLLMEDVM